MSPIVNVPRFFSDYIAALNYLLVFYVTIAFVLVSKCQDVKTCSQRLLQLYEYN